MEYSSVIRRTEPLVGTTSWMDQKGIILSKKMWISKDYVPCHFKKQHSQSKSTDTEKRSVAQRVSAMQNGSFKRVLF